MMFVITRFISLSLIFLQILYNILYFEDVLEAKVIDKILSDSLFAAINDSVFQKVMSLYKKQREEIGAVRHREKVISSNLENLEVVQTYDTEKDALNDDKLGGFLHVVMGKSQRVQSQIIMRMLTCQVFYRR